jgi:hypothetical protein
LLAGRVNAQAPSVPDVIRAHSFERVNSKGTVDAILRPSSDMTVGGTPGVAVCDVKGNTMAMHGVSHIVNKVTGAKTTTEPSLITLYDANGNVIFQKP